jgi:F420H(2)-dependent quinone reductase
MAQALSPRGIARPLVCKVARSVGMTGCLVDADEAGRHQAEDEGPWPLAPPQYRVDNQVTAEEEGRQPGNSGGRQTAMAYLRPPALTRRVVNRLAMRFSTGGVATLTVPGRRIGMPRKVPVIPVEVEGSRYLVSPYGESEWVRNLRAAGRGELRRKGHAETFEGQRGSRG